MLLIDNIKHLSASSINTFITNRPMWFARYHKGLKFKENYNTLRGKAVEDGIAQYLTSSDPNLQSAIEKAIDTWDRGVAWIPTGDNIDYKQSIAPLIKCAIPEYEEYGTPIVQRKIEVYLDGCSIPVIGYLDFLYESRIVDNKVSSKSPSKLSQDYTIQGAIYQYATGLPVTFLFEVPNKTAKVVKLDLENEASIWALKYATKAACAIERILTTPVDYDTMEAFMFPNPDACWNEDDANELLKAYGL